MLAHPSRLWQTLSALREEIPEADTLCHHHPSRIWRKSNWTHANEMQMKDSSKVLFIMGGCILAPATKAPRFIFSSGACGCIYTHPPTPYFLSLFLFISFPQLTPNPPLCISTITNYRHRNAGWNVWPGACRILYQTPHWYDSNNMGGKAIKTTLCFTSPIFSGFMENDHGGG